MERFRNRYFILSLIFVLVGIIMIFQLLNLQVIKGAENFEKSQNRLLSDRNIPAPRGNILDRYGVPLATSRQGYTIQIIKTRLKTNELNQMLLSLAKLLEKNGDSYTRGLARYINIDNGNIIYGTALQKIESEEDRIAKIKKDVGISYKDFDAKNIEEVFQYFKGKAMFGIDDKYNSEDAYRIMTMRFELLIRGFTSLSPITLATDVSRQSIAELEERHDDFLGVTSDIIYLRKYIDALSSSHVIGYLRNIDTETFKTKKDQGYRINDFIGYAGVELAAESYLKGRDGLKNIEIDTVGRTTKELNESSPVPGHDVVLTIDTKLQKVATDSLEKNINYVRGMADFRKNFGDAVAGAAVAIDVTSGEILAMTSYPNFDPGVFLEGSENRNAQKLIEQWMTDSKNRPMANRILQDQYAPGSTFKPITGIAGIEEGVITKDTKIIDNGRINIGNKDFYCLEYRDYNYSHGALDLSKALATSCNIFFHDLGNRIGIDKLDKWAKNFGLGEKTGIDVDSGAETKGIRANKEFKIKWSEGVNKYVTDLRLKESPNWFPANTADAAIGQSFNSFTPLQLANYVATISNGGKKYKPHLIKKVVKYDGSIVTETKNEFEKVPVNSDTIDAVKEGMIAVTNANDGTAVGIFDNLIYNGNKIQVAGKTGTAETGFANSSSNSLFVCYAPADNPKIAVAVVIEKGVWGAYAAPVARDIIATYFNVTSKTDQDDILRSDIPKFSR